MIPTTNGTPSTVVLAYASSQQRSKSPVVAHVITPHARSSAARGESAADGRRRQPLTERESERARRVAQQPSSEAAPEPAAAGIAEALRAAAAAGAESAEACLAVCESGVVKAPSEGQQLRR